MCTKPSSMIPKEPTRGVNLKPARKSRTKTRKPKFLSLRLEISPENSQQPGKMTTATNTNSSTDHQQLNLFPLHPENLVEDKEMAHEENVANYFFSAADGGASSTLTGLLRVDTSTSTTSSDEDNKRNSTLSPASLKYEEGEGHALVRTAMRSREREASAEEKWVCYSEVTSCAADPRHKEETPRGLSLKLDYQEIMDAWCDKGPLYVHVEAPQTVPDLHNDHDFFAHGHSTANVLSNGWSSNAGLWSVPEMSGSNSSIRIKDEVIDQGGDEDYYGKMGHREASVLRYKEKRLNRLFSKKIRYEVRKLNAEKRPRIKGRFVKRSCD
ncbi:hypothetical protein RJ639_020318 [Escallonia herrerae]|uniref:CCT domain-containing protein n=1 Tax=Escallonia herrerae TaxID=1293975 RepID=A0AA88V6V0_9ASTE|nr:hypothetical protein RJ639_020318 [Escallonia herrerae]